MDHLFLVRDVTDLSLSYDYLFNALKIFGFEETFISCIKLLYRGAAVMLKIGGGLSYQYLLRGELGKVVL